MKKVLSVLLAVMMMFAVMVPAFAADITKPDTTNTVQVKTSYNKDTDTTYTVTIPAAVTIPWGASSDDTTAPKTYDMTYTVNCQLSGTDQLKVVVSSANAFKMMFGTNSIAYTYTGSASKTFATSTTNGTDAAEVGVVSAQWLNKPVAEYVDTLTYTVSIETPAAG